MKSLAAVLMMVLILVSAFTIFTAYSDTGGSDAGEPDTSAPHDRPLLFQTRSASGAITGRNDISTGLPTSASFSTVEVYDSDEDGKDEIFMGGAGRDNPKTPGIHAFEYDPAHGQWEAFGSGLPGDGAGNYYGGLGLGDLNKDGYMDIVGPVQDQWYSSANPGVELYTNDGGGNGAFSLAHTLNEGQSCSEAEVADIDNDGNMDIAVSTANGLKVWFGSGSGSGTVMSWTESSPPATGNEMTGIGVGDLNHDGLLDLVGTPYFDSKAIRMYIQTSARTWKEIAFKDTANEAFGIKLRDLDGDSNADVIYGTRSEAIMVWLGNGGGAIGGTEFAWTAATTGLLSSSRDWAQVELADVSGDGRPDLIAAVSGQKNVHLFINDLPTGWTEILTGEDALTVGGSPYGANLGDWDGDGRLDAAGCSWGNGAKAWLLTREFTPGDNTTGSVKPTLGPFKYTDDAPVSGASVKLISTGTDQHAYYAVTNSEGYATFHMGINPGTYSCELILSGTEPVVVEVTIEEDGSVEYAGGAIPAAPLPDGPGADANGDEKEEKRSPFLTVPATIAVVLGVAVVVLIARKHW